MTGLSQVRFQSQYLSQNYIHITYIANAIVELVQIPVKYTYNRYFAFGLPTVVISKEIKCKRTWRKKEDYVHITYH